MTSKIPVCTSQGGPLWVGLVGMGLPLGKTISNQPNRTPLERINMPATTGHQSMRGGYTYEHSIHRAGKPVLEQDPVNDVTDKERARTQSPRAFLQRLGSCLSVASTKSGALDQSTIKPEFTGVVLQRPILIPYASASHWLWEWMPFGDAKVMKHVPMQITRVTQRSHLTSLCHVAEKTGWRSDNGPREVVQEHVNSNFNLSYTNLRRGISTTEEDERAKVPVGDRGLGRTRPREDVELEAPFQWVKHLSTGGTSQRSLWKHAGYEGQILNLARPRHPHKTNATIARREAFKTGGGTLESIKPG